VACYNGVDPALPHCGVGDRDWSYRNRSSLLGGLLVAQEWTLAPSGVLSMFLGTLLIVRSDVVLLSLIWLIGAYAIVFGVILIILAIQFRTAVTT